MKKVGRVSLPDLTPMQSSMYICLDIISLFCSYSGFGSVSQHVYRPSSQAHYRMGTDLLWDQKELLVYFMNPWNHPKDIPCETIIKWMNEWRGGEDNDASSVPKFVESRDQNDNDIRVQFDGMYIYYS